MMKPVLSALLFSIFFSACSKEKAPEPPPLPSPGGGETPVIKPVPDPETAVTMGFFLNDWQARTFVAPAFTEETPITTQTVNSVTIDASSIITKIPLATFGHNANIWMSPMVTEPIFMTHVTNLHPHIIRWPAGSGSDVYFWNQPSGALPSDAPAKIMDKNGELKEPGYGFGRTNNNWQASLDQYYSMLQQSNNQGMITVNYGYARYGTSSDPVATAAHLAADWVRYDNGRTKYWEIGNESYGDWEWGYRIDLSQNKDGQPEYLTGKLYAQHVQVFVDSMKKAATELGSTIYIGATMYESAIESWQTNTLKTWNSSMLPELNNKPDFFIVHNYFTNYNENSTASQILTAAESVPGKMMNLLKTNVMNNGSSLRPVALTEWNMWAKDSKQQVSNISGLFAILIQGKLLENNFGMGARWDMLNGWDNGNDHGLFSDGNEPGIPKWTPRPSFYYMYYFQKMMGDRLVPVNVNGTTAIKAFASTYSSGQANVTLINTTSTPVTIEVKANNFNIGNRFYYYKLEGSNDNGEFSRKVLVNGSGPAKEAGGPADYSTLKAKSSNTLNGVKVIVPGFGAICMVIDKK